MAECRDSLVNNTNTPQQKQSLILGHKDSAEENKTDKVMEPMLIEDFRNGNMPQSFRKVHQATLEKGNNAFDKNDELIILLHILMLESGFVLRIAAEDSDSEDAAGIITFHYKRFLKNVCDIPNTWKKSSSHYDLPYVLPPFPQHTCRLICSAIAEDILVNCVVENIEGASYCLLIDPSLYIMTSTTKLCNRFQNMPHLSRTFKSGISNYAKITILKHHGLKAACLEDMPPEILTNIVQNLTPRTLAMFELTCAYFRKVSNDPMVWKKVNGSKYESFEHFKRAEVTRLKLRNVINRFDVGRFARTVYS